MKLKILINIFIFISLSYSFSYSADHVPNLVGTWIGENETLSEQRGFRTWEKKMKNDLSSSRLSGVWHESDLKKGLKNNKDDEWN